MRLVAVPGIHLEKAEEVPELYTRKTLDQCRGQGLHTGLIHLAEIE